MFKTKKYFNIRKVAEAVSRLLSNSVDPLFYLSSFQTQTLPYRNVKERLCFIS